MFFKRDEYLKKFVNYCMEKFGNELAGIIVFGSYVQGHFDKRKSDYDIFVLFKRKVINGRRNLEKKFPKTSIQYYLSLKELEDMIHFGHFTSYITLLSRGGKIVYSTLEFRRFLKSAKKQNILDKPFDVAGLEYKTNYEVKNLKRLKGYNSVKWAVPMIRKRLQMLTFLRKNKLVWDLGKNVKINKKFLSDEEKDFILDLNKRLKKRSNVFSKKDNAGTLNVVYKLNNEILSSLVF